MNELLAV